MLDCLGMQLKRGSNGIAFSPENIFIFFSNHGFFRALSAGIKRPLLSLLPVPNDPQYKHGNLVSILGALHALYVVSFVV